MKKASKKSTKAKTAKKKVTKKASPKKAKSAKTKKKSAKKSPAAKGSTKKAAKKTAKKAAKRSARKVPKKAPAKKAALKKAASKKSVAKKASPKKAAPKKKAKAPVARRPELPLGARAAPVPSPTITPESPDAILLALAGLLLDDPQYHEDVRLAVESPQDYVETFADELTERGITEPQPHLPWVALTNGLSQRNSLVPLDRNFEPDDLSEALETLVGKRKGIDLSGLPGYDDSAGALRTVGDRLQAAGLALVTVDSNKEEDTFPLAIISEAHVEEAQRLAASLGLGTIRRWSSDSA